MNKTLPRSLLLALGFLPLAAAPHWARAQAAFSTRLAILAPQDLFPEEKPRQEGKAKKEAGKK